MHRLDSKLLHLKTGRMTGHLYTGIKKKTTHVIVKAIHSSLRPESKSNTLKTDQSTYKNIPTNYNFFFHF